MRTRIVLPAAAACATAAVLGAGALASGSAATPDRAAARIKLENHALFAVLSGRNEIGDDGRKGAGDRDGRGTFTATVDGGRLCFGITVKNIDEPVAAHIHKGRADQNGSIVVPLMQPTGGDPDAVGGCVDIDRSLSRAILKSPAKYYANVHTIAFGGGAVRGQLFRVPR